MQQKFQEDLHHAQQQLELATSENIVEHCQKYFSWLKNRRDELYKFRGSAEINRQQKTAEARQTVDRLRKEIRATVEILVREQNRIEALLKSLTMLSGSEAVATLNKSGYKGFNDWELKAGGARFGGGSEADKISVQDAVATASRLRCEEYLSRKTVLESDK